MTIDEIKRATKHLGGLFSGQVTQELATLIKGDWRMLDYKISFEVINTHKRNSPENFLNYGKLMGELRAAHKPTAMQQPATNTLEREGTWCDVHRRQNPQFTSAGDYEVVLRVHRSFWRQAQKSSKNPEMYRDKYRREAVALLESFGMKPEISGEWADTVFVDDPEHFRTALHQLRGDMPEFAQAEMAGAEA